MKKNNFIIFFIVILVILLTAFVVLICKNKDVSDSTEVSSNTENLINDSNEINKITDDERKEIEEYTNKICNLIVNCKISEFKDINEANRVWIYSHLYAEDETNLLTEKQIKLQLEKLFGSNLNLDIEKDIELNKDLRMPQKEDNEGESNKYFLPILGMDHTIYYVIDGIEKKENEYVVTVIEVDERTDLENDNEGEILSISSYDDNDKINEVFKISSDKLIQNNDKTLLNPVIKEKVLAQKDKFSKYNLIIKNEDNNLYVNEVHKVK